MLGCVTLLKGALPATRPSAVLPDQCPVFAGLRGKKATIMSISNRPIPKHDTILLLRNAIAEAGDSGSDLSAMTLHLTHRDAALLKRSPTVAMEEISFVGGEMRFLGVKVDVGQVTVSALGA